jgi:hypothetical protein
MSNELARLSEEYLRADQEWRLAKSRTIVEHRGEGSELVVSAIADVETEDLCRKRLEALVAFDQARIELESGMMTAVQAGYSAATVGWLRRSGEKA